MFRTGVSSRRAPLLWIGAILQLSGAGAVGAQPWVPPQGEGTVSLTYQNYYVVGHFDVAGRENTNGATHAKAVLAELDFALTDSVGVSVSLPFIATRYTGPAEYIVGGIPTHPGPLDDGTYHGTFQDLHAEVRRLWWAGPLAIAPFIGATVPTHAYETHGEAVAGKHRPEVQIGGSAGADFTPLVPGAYVHGRYGLAIAERRRGFSSVRSLVNLEGGYAIWPRLVVRGLGNWRIAHDGPTIRELADDDWLGHDRFIVSSDFAAGVGLTLSMSQNTELSALWIATISGRGGAHRARTLAIGASWSFGARMEGFEPPEAVIGEPSQSRRRVAGSGR